jgi:hypothetical protein
MRDGNYVGIGWRKLGDLSNLTDDDPKAEISRRYEASYFDPAAGQGPIQAEVILRPVNLLVVEKLLGEKNVAGKRRRIALAQ